MFPSSRVLKFPLSLSSVMFHVQSYPFKAYYLHLLGAGDPYKPFKRTLVAQRVSIKQLDYQLEISIAC